jgi:hypothetical protein
MTATNARFLALALWAGCAAPPAIACGAQPAEPLRETAALGEPRASHTATRLPDGRVLVAGGFRKGPDGYRQIWSASTEIYDPAKGAFRPGPRLLSARGGQTATVLVDGRVLLAGGWSDAGMLASTEIYDPASGGFRSAGTMAFARAGHTATRLRDGRVVLAGGGDAVASATIEIFDPICPDGSVVLQRIAARTAGGS